MQAWIGEAQAGAHNHAQALKSYNAAAADLEEDKAHFDDARCDLAMVETKIGNALFKMGKSQEARSHYEKALDTAKVPVSLEHNDFPALYAAAEAYAGMGDVSLSEARHSASLEAHSRLWNDPCVSYEKSLGIWKHIPNPSRFSGNGYLASDPLEIEHRLQACRTALVRH